MEQLCICLRYFNPSTKELVERIICLYEIHSQTGEVLAIAVLYLKYFCFFIGDF